MYFFFFEENYVVNILLDISNIEFYLNGGKGPRYEFGALN